MRPSADPPPLTRHPRRRGAPFLEDVPLAEYAVVEGRRPVPAAPLVSIVVPVRNRRDLVGDTLRALFAQDMPDGAYEVIVVDNASTDGTRALLEEAAHCSPAPFSALLSSRNRGPSASRNAGLLRARGLVVAFTDSDCVPTSGWLRSMMGAFTEGVGVVQGRTIAHPDQPQPLFNHFIETLEFDGSYSTSNVAYLRAAAVDAGGFDPGCAYWEDVDLGWRLHRAGWRSAFSREALVYHQVLRLSPSGWLRNAWHYHIWPAKAARYPEFGRYLIAGTWSDRSHLYFQACALGVFLARWRRAFALLALPYLVLTYRERWVGRCPPLRVAAHVLRDGIALAAALSGSVRFRRLVL